MLVLVMLSGPSSNLGDAMKCPQCILNMFPHMGTAARRGLKEEKKSGEKKSSRKITIINLKKKNNFSMLKKCIFTFLCKKMYGSW